MKKLSLLFLFLAGLMVAIQSCNDDDDPVVPGSITITGVPPTATVPAGTPVTASASVTAEDGLDQLVITKDGSNYETVDLSGSTTGSYDFSYTPTQDEQGSSIVFEFTVSDVDGDTESVTHVLNVSAFVPTYAVIDATEERGPNEDETTTYPQNEVTGVINEDYTFTNDIVWVLNGRVVVDAGATLTIEPGTIIKGAQGGGALASLLLVASGAMIDAQGEPDNPIVFTSILDNINLAGQAYYDSDAGTIVAGDDSRADGFTSRGLDVDTDIGLWGGVAILGDAPISAGGTGGTALIEGIPASVTQAVYGGSNAEHDGGTFTYASIRFTGTQLGPGNEIQGLSLGGVGTGTTIDHVESIASADDGIEIFGGSVNITNFIVWGQEDDGYDGDQAWTGSVSNFIYLGTNAGADHAFELDGPEGDSKGIGTFENGTVWGGNSDDMIDFRDDAEYTMDNILFYAFGADAGIDLESEGADDTENSDNYLVDETIILTNLQFYDNTLNTLADIMNNVLDDTQAQTDADNKFALEDNNNAIIADMANITVGADATVFDWSFTAAAFPGWDTVLDIDAVQ